MLEAILVLKLIFFGWLSWKIACWLSQPPKFKNVKTFVESIANPELRMSNLPMPTITDEQIIKNYLKQIYMKR